MIHLEFGQNVPENENLRVFSPTGDYGDEELVECYDVSKPGMAICAFSASFIKYGSLVYRFGNPESLGEALIKIDQESKHDAVAYYKEERVRKYRREHGDFRPDNPAAISARQGKDQKSKTNIEEVFKKIEETEKKVEEIIELPPVAGPTSSPNPALTPAPPEMSTSTPSVVEAVPEVVEITTSTPATSTEAVLPPVEPPITEIVNSSSTETIFESGAASSTTN